MNAYTRFTRECTFEDMACELHTAICEHIEKYQLGEIESSHPICFETISTCRKTGLFANGDTTTITGMLITPQLLVWTSEKKWKACCHVRVVAQYLCARFRKYSYVQG